MAVSLTDGVESTILYEQIDCEIRSLVRMVNRFPGVRTVSSCAGHQDGAEAEIDFMANSQADACRLFSAMPFWGFRGAFINNRPQRQVIWATVTPSEQGALEFKLRIDGEPFVVQRETVWQVERALAEALSRLGGMPAPCPTYVTDGMKSTGRCCLCTCCSDLRTTYDPSPCQ